MKLVPVLSILFLLVGTLSVYDSCSREVTAEEGKRTKERVEYTLCSNALSRLERDFAEKMLGELSLIHTSSTNSIQGKVEDIGMRFYACRRATVDEARALHFLVQEKLVDAVNADENLRPFLAEYPFTHSRVAIEIYFKNNFDYYSDGSISSILNVPGLPTVVTSNQNRRFYDTRDSFTGKFIPLLDETFEECIRRVSEHPVPNPAYHQKTALEEAIDAFFLHYASEMQNKHQFRCVSVGGKIHDKIEEVSVSFTMLKPPEKNEARKWIVLAAEELLDRINRDEKLKPYFIESSFPIGRLKIRISFRNKRHYRYHDGSIESVTIEGDTVKYFQDVSPAADSYPLHPPCIDSETYIEAKSRLSM